MQKWALGASGGGIVGIRLGALGARSRARWGAGRGSPWPGPQGVRVGGGRPRVRWVRRPSPRSGRGEAGAAEGGGAGGHRAPAPRALPRGPRVPAGGRRGAFGARPFPRAGPGPRGPGLRRGSRGGRTGVAPGAAAPPRGPPRRRPAPRRGAGFPRPPRGGAGVGPGPGWDGRGGSVGRCRASSCVSMRRSLQRSLCSP